VDWSGAADPRAAARAIWCAVVDDGRLVGLESGRGRAETTSHLIALAAEEPETVIGLDFCFSAPAWFLDEHRMRSAGELWRWAARQADQDPAFVRGLGPPFWGPGVRPRPQLGGDPLRITDHEVAAPGVQPSSFFRISGPGSVGAQSLLGMPELLVLCDAGIGVWPFDPPRLPVAIEVFPRSIARAVSPDHAHLQGDAMRHAMVTREERAFGAFAPIVADNQDAFDAAIVALALARATDLDQQLGRQRSVQEHREGAIFVPELQ
jgi:hypothetical protein